MKDKVVYVLIGMILMYLGMILLGFSRTPNTVITPKLNTQILGQNISVEDASNVNEAVAEKIDNSEKNQTIDKHETADQPPSAHTNKTQKALKQSSIFRSLKLQKMKVHLAKTLKLDPLKLEQVSILADKKMVRDEELQNMVSIDIDDEVALAQQQLITKDDSELTLEQRNIKNAQIEKGEQFAIGLEQSRVEFEDQLSNLLSASELNAFRQQESETAQAGFERYVDALDNNARINIDGLNDFQSSQLEQLVNEFSNRELGEVPIGSSVSSNPITLNGNAQEQVGQFYNELESILSAEQMEGFRTSPIMFDVFQ